MLPLAEAAQTLRAAFERASRGLVEREVLVELVALAAVAGEHVLVVGPPGTAKSEAVRRVSAALGGRYFEYLLGRFTEPSELFGPVDLRQLREGRVETDTSGMLPEAEVAFLDEVFLGSTAILNTLLGLLNERRFRRGHTDVPVPLRVCVGATNLLPDEPALAAFADRFLVRAFIEGIPDPRLEDLLESGWALDRQPPQGGASIAHLDRLATAARDVDLSAVRPHLAHAVRLLRSSGISLSDRRIVKSQRLVAAAATLAGRTTATAADLWPVIYVVPTAEAQEVARDVLRDRLATSRNANVPAAAAEASLGPLARADRIAERGRQLLAAMPDRADAEAMGRWRLAAESVGRAIDATFDRDALPDELRQLRATLLRVISDAA